MTRSAFGVVALLLLAAVAVAVGLARCEGTPPRVSVAGPITLGQSARTITVEASDDGAGLRSLHAVLVHPGGTVPLAARSFGGSALPYVGSHPAHESTELTMDAKALGLAEGEATLRVSVRDLSWRDFGRGNEAVLELPVTIDFRPPSLTLAPGITYARRAGSVALAYHVSEDTERDGVEVEGVFYPGVRVRDLPDSEGAPPGARFVLFPLSQEVEPDAKIRVVAIDRAGNRAERTPQIHIADRVYPTEKINLSQRFLDEKVPNLAAATGVQTDDHVKAFQEINTRIRRENEEKIREITRQSAPGPLFSGAFEQMRNSKVMSSFAERRTYYVGGEKVSESIHYGYDLASLAGAPIHAANSGKVIWAGELGIYGNCVIIDHGLGLASLYGHLSNIDVHVGDTVQQDQVLGQSGQTGLAGGDHLHFAMLLRGVYVDPVEWWDPKWIRDRYAAVLAAARE